jgi:hypothetical protein
MSTRLIEDRAARALALRELREVLAAMKELAAAPPPAIFDPAPGQPAGTSEADFLEAIRAARAAGQPVVLPGGGSVEYVGPTPALLQLLERLTYLLGLSDLEREFLAAGAAREVPDAWDGLAAYADWIEERDNYAGAVRVRKLTPQSGDLLVFRCEPEAAHHAARAAAALAADLESRGCPVVCSLLPPGAALDSLSEECMATLGWVRAERGG